MPVAFPVPSFTREIFIKDFVLPSSLPITFILFLPRLATCHVVRVVRFSAARGLPRMLDNNNDPRQLPSGRPESS